MCCSSGIWMTTSHWVTGSRQFKVTHFIVNIPGVQNQLFSCFYTLQESTIFFLNITNWLPSNAASHLRRWPRAAQCHMWGVTGEGTHWCNGIKLLCAWNDLLKVTTQIFTSNLFPVKVKVIPQHAEVAQGVPDRLRSRIFLTFGTTRVVGHQPYAPAAFTLGEIPGTHFQRLSRLQGTWFCWGSHRKNPQGHHQESIPGPSD